MCGIAGAIGALDPSLEAQVRVMTDAELHRGPDDSGFYRSPQSPGVAFGFRRLSIIDLSTDGHQPMVDEQRQNVVVFNGEIYNYAELRSELEAAGVRFRSKGDTEVLLRAYGHWGKAAVSRLRGMFAFAIYDPEQRQALLARDRLGIKPLYYATLDRPGGKVLLFASELRALLATGLFPPKLDPLGLATYFWNGFVIGPSTIVSGISLLEPGATVLLKLDNPVAKPERYWSIGTQRSLPTVEAKEALEQTLLTAAQQHLVSDVPLGVFLSGGVDSSAIASLAVRAGGRRVQTFHIGFDEAGFDESMYARRVATGLGTEHVEFRLTQARFRGELEQALASLDQPTFDGINTYFVSRVVREAGFTVALAGTGGDELFGGYTTFRDLPRAGMALRALRFVPDSLLGRASQMLLRWKLGVGGEMPPQTRWGKLRDVLATRGDALALYQVSSGLYTQEFLRSLLESPLQGLAENGLPPARARDLAGTIRSATPLSAVSQLELALFVGERLLRDTDAASMANSLEVRVPLLDHLVVEAVQAVPDQARYQPLGKKSLLKALAMPKLDQTIFDRPKAGFVLPIEVWAKDQLAQEIGAMFADRALVESVGLRPDALARLWRGFRAGEPGLYWSRIWSPYVLLRWCKQHGASLA